MKRRPLLLRFPLVIAALAGLVSVRVSAQLSDDEESGLASSALLRLLRASDLVVRARVRDVQAVEPGPGGREGIHRRVDLDVLEEMQGDAPPTLVTWAHGGRIGDRARMVIGQAEFTAGEEVVVFLYRVGATYWPVDMAEGCRRVEGDTVTAHGEPTTLDALRTLVARSGRR
jgi:hypothetical protein